MALVDLLVSSATRAVYFPEKTPMIWSPPPPKEGAGFSNKGSHMPKANRPDLTFWIPFLATLFTGNPTRLTFHKPGPSK